MAREGVFDDLDLAFMMHGSDTTTVDGKSLALNLVNIKFHGKSAHAAIAPEKGISALDAVLLFFNGMEYLREHVPTEVRMHGIITDGGKAANIVPDYACTQMVYSFFQSHSSRRGCGSCERRGARRGVTGGRLPWNGKRLRRTTTKSMYKP